MTNFILIVRSEVKHFLRSPFKIFSVLLFMVAAVYALQNGYRLFQIHQSGVAAIQQKNADHAKEVAGWFDEGKKGPEDRPWIDVTMPYWANWFAFGSAVKPPSPLMPFSIGQAEQFGYYMKITCWSTTFDSELAEELANPERLTVGTLDFGFVLLYLFPILAIILLFNIGGLEVDYAFNRLIVANVRSRNTWILARFSFYFLLSMAMLLVLMLPYAALSGALHSQLSSLVQLFLYIVLYSSLWFFSFFLINIFGKGSANQAMKMIGLWLTCCVIIPGSIHQISSLKFPTNYMTDYIDANRDESNKIWELSTEEQYNKMLELNPELGGTVHGQDTVLDEGIVNNSLSLLVNNVMQQAQNEIENSQEQKNAFIKSMYLISPVSFFQNKINELADNDYYAYKRFRSTIQKAVDNKINLLVFDCWNKKTIDKDQYLKYVKSFNQ